MTDYERMRVVKLIKEARNYATLLQDQSPPMAEALVKTAAFTEENLESLSEIGVRHAEGKLEGMIYATAAYLNGARAALL